MTQYVFGTGQLYSIPTGGGNPLRIGALQDVSVEFSGDVKMLYGQYQFPLDVARGKTKIEGKIGSGNIDVAAFNTIFFGQTVTGNSEKKKPSMRPVQFRRHRLTPSRWLTRLRSLWISA